MERINLNIPSDARRRLRSVARRLRKTEAEVARSLLLAALARSEEDEFYRRVAEAQTEQSKARHLEILAAFERMDD